MSSFEESVSEKTKSVDPEFKQPIIITSEKDLTEKNVSTLVVDREKQLNWLVNASICQNESIEQIKHSLGEIKQILKEKETLDASLLAEDISKRVSWPTTIREGFRAPNESVMTRPSKSKNLKMLSRRFSIKELDEIEATEIEDVVDKIKKYKVPGLDFRQLYKMGPIDRIVAHRFKNVEFTSSCTQEETRLHLITPHTVKEAKKNGFNYLHIGGVQVTIKLLARKDLDGSAIAILTDERIQDFDQSLLGAVEAGLNEQVIFFTVLPDFTVDIEDASQALLLTLKTHGISFKQGMKSLSVEVSLYYKLMKSNHSGYKLKQKKGSTTLHYVDPRSKIMTPQAVNWKQVQFPIEWKVRESLPLLQKSETISQIYENKNGTVSIRFDNRKWENSEETEPSHRYSSFEERDLKAIRSIETLEDLEKEFEETNDPDRLEYIIKRIAKWEYNTKVVVEDRTEEGESSGVTGDHPNPEGTQTHPSVTVINNTRVVQEPNLPTTGRMPVGREGDRNREDYTPKTHSAQPIATTGQFLNIDCVKDLIEAIKVWTANSNLTIGTIGRQWDNDQAQSWIELTFAGMVKDWWESFRQGPNHHQFKEMIKLSRNAADYASLIYREFIGEVHEHGRTIVEDNKRNLANLTICNMKYFEEYTCEFQKYFYKVGEINNEWLMNLFIEKLPKPWNVEIQKEINLIGLQQNTLGERIRISREFIKKACIANKLRSQAKRQLKGSNNFCYGIVDNPTQWGCHEKGPNTHKNRKFRKPFNRFRKSRTFKKQGRYPGKRYFKRKTPQRKEARKDCKCWLCNEVGHYANTCPKKKSSNVKIIQEVEYWEPIVNQAEEEGYEIVDSEGEENESIYSLDFSESDSEGSEFEELSYSLRMIQVKNWKIEDPTLGREKPLCEINSEHICSFQKSKVLFKCEHCHNIDNEEHFRCEQCNMDYHEICYKTSLMKKLKMKLSEVENFIKNSFEEELVITYDDKKDSVVHVDPSSTYIRTEWKFKGYEAYHIDAFLDTGAGFCIGKTHLIPTNMWKKASIPIRGITANSQEVLYDLVAVNIPIKIAGEKFIIDKLWQGDDIGCDILLGNNFLKKYTPFTQHHNMISLTPTSGADPVYTAIIKAARHVVQEGFLPSKQKTQSALAKRGITQHFDIKILPEIEIEEEEENLLEEMIENIDSFYVKKKAEKQMIKSLDELRRDLVENLSDQPLKLWEKDRARCKINIIDPTVTIRLKPMSYNEEDRLEFKKQIEELIEMGLIRKSTSPHSSPAFLVRNHAEITRGKARMVINYKRLNDYTILDGHYIPNKEVLINRIQGKRYFSKFDCKSGYWQIKMEEESIPYTAFSTPQGHYEWLVMPFGLKNAPQQFQQRMDEIFAPHQDYCMVYIDDILVFSETKNQHRQDLEKVIQAIKMHGIIISAKKMQLEQTKIDFLGLTIDEGNIVLQPHTCLKLIQFPDKLEDAKQLQRFLGCAQYLSDFIPNLAQIRIPLNKLLTKNVKWHFLQEHIDCIKKIKEIARNLEPMKLPMASDTIIIETDASDVGWGGILKAKPEGTIKENLCKHASGSFKKAEINYHTIEKEILAIMNCIKKFEIFLGNKKFVIRTDCKYFKTFMKNKLDKSLSRGRLMRWQSWLTYFNFEVEHVSGIANCLPDALTREMAKTTIACNLAAIRTAPEVAESSSRKRFASDKEANPRLAKACVTFGNYVLEEVQESKRFRTNKSLKFGEKLLLDNLWANREKKEKMLETLKALTEYMAQKSKKSIKTLEEKCLFFEKDRVALKAKMMRTLPKDLGKMVLETPTTGEKKWISFLELLWKNKVPKKAILAKGVVSDHLRLAAYQDMGQEQKVWAFENGFLECLQTNKIEDLAGFPECIIQACKDLRKEAGLPIGTIMLKFVSAPPEWEGTKLFPSYHLVRVQVNPWSDTWEESLVKYEGLDKEVTINVDSISSTRAFGIVEIEDQIQNHSKEWHLIQQTERIIVQTDYCGASKFALLYKQIQMGRMEASQATRRLVEDIKYEAGVEDEEDLGLDFYESLDDVAIANLENAMEA